MSSLRERQREERAALILSAAQDVFADKGYYESAIDAYTRMHERRNQALLELHNSMGLTKSVLATRPQLQSQIARALDHITALLEEGKRGGELDSNVPTPVMLATFVTLLSPGGYEQLLLTDQVTPGGLAAHVGRIFFPPLQAYP